MTPVEPEDWPDLLLSCRRPGLRRRGRPADPRKDPPAPWRRQRTRRRGQRLRGVHLALPGELERAAGPLAVLDGLDFDALGRPRHERRLEHLPVLDGGDAGEGLVAPAADRLRAELLALPAPRQPLAAGARRRRDLPRGARRRRTRRRGGAARLGRRRLEIRSRQPLELLPRLRPHAGDLRRLAGRKGAGRGPAGDGRRRGVGVDRRTRAGRLRPPADRDHGAVAALARIPRLEAWNEAVCDGAWGTGSGATRGEASARSRLRPLGLLRRLVREAARPAGRSRARRARRAPASVVVLAGDVHHAYLSEVG